MDSDAATYRIEQDDSTKRMPSGNYTYRIYKGDHLIARFWHDFRGDENGIEFVFGGVKDVPFRTIEFIEGGGREPPRLSERAVAFLRDHSKDT